MGKEDTMTNEEKASLTALSKSFEAFIDVYEKDMRGDNDPTSKNVGIIGELRELKKYPSIAYNMAYKPLQTIAAIIGIFVILDTLSTFGVLRWLASVIDFRIPGIIP
jgi:hypothetical protein